MPMSHRLMSRLVSRLSSHVRARTPPRRRWVRARHVIYCSREFPVLHSEKRCQADNSARRDFPAPRRESAVSSKPPYRFGHAGRMTLPLFRGSGLRSGGALGDRALPKLWAGFKRELRFLEIARGCSREAAGVPPEVLFCRVIGGCGGGRLRRQRRWRFPEIPDFPDYPDYPVFPEFPVFPDFPASSVSSAMRAA